MLLDRDRSMLLVVDMQSKLLPAMSEPDRVLRNCGILMRAAEQLAAPVLVSEQYPKGLGPTHDDLASRVDRASIREKVSFSCLGDDGIAARLRDAGRSQFVVCGIESHVCVTQTAMDLAREGSEVAVVADAVDSRTPRSREIALDRLARAGVEIVTTEMVLFEWMRRADIPEFRQLSGLIK